jgi:tetrapyrrole methylase family protein/MazG family protein
VGDDTKLREELGDVLLQVAMHAAIAEEQGRFDAVDVSESEASKMVARHPHVFGDVRVDDAAEVLRNWEHSKIAEAAARGASDESVLDRVPRTLPALAWTLNLQKRAARVGFDNGDGTAAANEVAKVVQELTQSTDDDEVFRKFGDLLFALVSVARHRKVNPEDALRAGGQRFALRFKAIEAAARGRGLDLRALDRAGWQSLWDETA